MMDSNPAPFLLRREIFSLIEKRIEALEKGYRQNLGLIGPRGFGKTLLLEKLFQSLSCNSNLIPIYVSADALDFDNLVDRWTGSLLNGFFKSQGMEVAPNFHSLLLAADPHIPKTTEKIRHLKKNLRKEKSFAVLYKELFNLSEVLGSETGKKLILMIDEFDQLEEITATDPFGALGREIMLQKNTLYVMASASLVHAREIFREKLSMLFGNFEVLEINPLGFEETVRFIESQLPNVSMSRAQHQYLIRLTDGNPEYLSMILEQLQKVLMQYQQEPLAIGSDQRNFSNAFLVEAVSRELSPFYGRLSRQFDARLQTFRQKGKEAGACLRALVAISQGRRRIQAIAPMIDRKILETKKILGRLAEENTVVRRGDFYMIEDPLFRFYLREVFERMQHLYQPSPQEMEREMMRALYQEMEYCQAEVTECYGQRIEKLFKEFRNETLELQSRRMILPQFNETHLKLHETHKAVIVARNTKLRWHCQLHYEKILEDEVVHFLEEIKKYRKRPQQRILVMLQGIDQNAKLIAQEAGIQLWDLRTMNNLLDLYGLPKIILLADKENYGSNVGALAQSVYTA